MWVSVCVCHYIHKNSCTTEQNAVYFLRGSNVIILHNLLLHLSNTNTLQTKIPCKQQIRFFYRSWLFQVWKQMCNILNNPLRMECFPGSFGGKAEPLHTPLRSNKDLCRDLPKENDEIMMKWHRKTVWKWLNRHRPKAGLLYKLSWTELSFLIKTAGQILPRFFLSLLKVTN